MRLGIALHALRIRGQDHIWPRPVPCYLYGLPIWLEAKIRLRPWPPTFPAGCSVLASPPQGRRRRRRGPRPGERVGEPADRHERDAAHAAGRHQQSAPYVPPSATCAAGACHLPGETVSLNLFDIAERRFMKHKPGTWLSQEAKRAFLIMDRCGDISPRSPSWAGSRIGGQTEMGAVMATVPRCPRAEVRGARGASVAVGDQPDRDGEVRHLYPMLNAFGIAERAS
jgi:hypothetical protein